MFDLKEHLDFVGSAIVGLLYVVNELRKRWESRRRSPKSRIDFDSEIRAQIDSILYQMLIIYRACRVNVIQFHNGDEYYTGQSRIRMTITNEVVYPDVKRIALDFTGVQVSANLHMLLRDIRVNDYTYIESRKEGREWSDTLYDTMIDLDMKSFILLRLADSKNGETVAILALHFPHENALHRDSITTLLRSKKRLETIFDRL